MGTVQAPTFRPNADYWVAEWLYLVEALLDNSSKWSGDSWSPFAQAWRRRAEALLAASVDARPYYDEWIASPARKHEGAAPPDPMERPVDEREAAMGMLRSAESELKEDVSILRRARDHVSEFADPKTQVHVGELPDVRPSEWDLRPFNSTGRLTVPAPIPDVRPDVFGHPSSPKRQTARRGNTPEEPVSHPIFAKVGRTSKPRPAPSGTNKVFIVHGRDHGPRDAIRVMLLGLGVEPVVLEDETNRGRTLIEKFEHHADVGYAVVILVPEDQVTGADGKPEVRPRQNVVLEFGFLMGMLGREKVAVVVVDHPERPSDVDGIAYIPYDSNGGWKLSLARELRDAGFDIDFGRL